VRYCPYPKRLGDFTAGNAAVVCLLKWMPLINLTGRISFRRSDRRLAFNGEAGGLYSHHHMSVCFTEDFNSQLSL
jgi:hypothetical protein